MDGTFLTETDCEIGEFDKLCSRTLTRAEVPLAAAVEKNIPVYDCDALRDTMADRQARRPLMAEWARVLHDLSGVVVLKRAYADTTVIDEATRVFERIIADEKSREGGGADHFAAAGANDRIWNSAQKLCLADPHLFARYHGNPAVDAVCEAWLGPNYQMTAQVNLVRPGGKAQTAHRDYHLGFQTGEVAAQYPMHAHLLSAVLTLQGAVSHIEMPVEAGPTKLLPFSQLFTPGYLAYRQQAFRDYFEAHHVQLPLSKGDAVFFNPALFHAGGENKTSDVQRMVNLFQVSSAFGRAMESLDRVAMTKALMPALRDLKLPAAERHAAISAAAEGYSFPTNLDTDPPAGGLAPETQAALLARALDVGMGDAEFRAAVDSQTARRAP